MTSNWSAIDLATDAKHAVHRIQNLQQKDD